MSHIIYEPVKQRLQRSELAVPGSSPNMFEKALKSAADFVFLDLEDAVAPDDKVTARKNVIDALQDLDWQGNGKTISVRINSIDTHYMYRDVVEVVEQAGQHLDTILLPKAGTASDVYMLSAMLNQIETSKGFKHRIGIEVLIETTLGMANVMDIAKCGREERLEAMHFGVADYAASCRARTTVIGGLNPNYPGDQWHAGLSQMLVACRAYGFRGQLMDLLGILMILSLIKMLQEEGLLLALRESGQFTLHKLSWLMRFIPLQNLKSRMRNRFLLH